MRPNQRRILVTPDRERSLGRGFPDPGHHIRPTDLVERDPAQILGKIGVLGVDKDSRNKGRRIANPQKQLDLVIGKKAHKPLDFRRGPLVEDAIFENELGDTDEGAVRHDEPVDRLIVEDRVEQNIARIGRGGGAVQVQDRLADDPPVFAGARDLDAFGGKGIDVLEEGFQKPVFVCAIGADVIDDLHGTEAALVFRRTIVAFLDSETAFG